jgi:hypothetical protein
MWARTTRERGRRARVSGCHAGPTCLRGRHRARALLVWAGANARPRREGESRPREWGKVGRGKGSQAEGARRETGRDGLGSRFAFYFLPFSFLILLKLKSILIQMNF